MKNLILSPHFDDAVLSLGGLLTQEGGASVVATFFAGMPPQTMLTRWDITCGFKDSTDAIRGRTEEDRESLNFLGITNERIRTYKHLDSQYRLPNQRKKDPYPDEPELEAAIAKDIVSLVREFEGPLKVFAPGFEVYAHVDHRVVRHAALAALRELPQGSVEFFFYQDLPYSLDIMNRMNPRSRWNIFAPKDVWRDYSPLERVVTQGVPAVSPVVIPLSHADMQRKLQGVALYRSQVDHLGKHLLKRLKKFAAGEAKSLSLSAPYCEVVYKLAAN
jgi:LmbE family N-acetylglucosaminyl deacetylase